MYYGDFRTGKTVRGMWASNAIAGESITRATNGTISVYKDGGTTQTTTGVTDTEDFDSLTGVHYVAIDTSADGTFYSAGSDFHVVLSAATIDGKTINAFLFSFSLENRSALLPTTDGRKLDVSAGGEAGVDWANVGSPTATVGLSGTTVKTATDVETDTADIQSRLPAALTAGGNIKADALALSGDATAADNAEAFFDGTGYAGTGNVIPTVTSVTAIAADAITAASIATGAVDADAIAADAGVEIAAAVWDRVLNAANHNIASSAGRRLRALAAASIRDGTAQAGASNSITLDAAASATNEIYDSNLVVIVGGTGEGQARVIVEYNGTTKVAIVDRVWDVNPDVTSEFQILADHQSDLSHHGLAQGGGATSITLSSTASAVDDTYVGSHVFLSTSTGTGQTRLITDYDGTTKVATVSPAWATNPGSASVYKIIPAGRSIVETLGAQALADVRTALGLASANLDTQLDALPTNSELATALGTADDAVLAAIAALNNLSAAQVNTEVDTALNDYDGPTNTELTAALAAADDAVLAAIAALNNLSQAGIRTALGMASANLDTQLAAIDDYIDAEVAAIKVVTDKINTAMELDGAVYRFTTNALEMAPAGGGGGGGDATAANQLLILDQLDVIQAKTDLITADTEINILASIVGTTMNIVRGCTLTANFSALGALTGRTALYITVKRDVEDADTDAIFKIEETAGLQVLNGSYYDPTAGIITVTNAATGALTVTLTAAAAKLLNTSRRLYYDMKMVTGAVVTQLISGYATVTGDVTRLD